MVGWIEIASWTAAALIALPFVVLTVELCAAQWPIRRQPIFDGPRPALAVIVPAHNEATGIASTVSSIQTQLLPGDRVVVIADNCTDETVAAARSSGAEVVERIDVARRGKGFALDFGLKHLAADPPKVVIVIDADTQLLPNALDELAQQVAATNRPAQAENVLDAPARSTPAARIGAFAFFLKNVIRPRGLNRLGLPCLLYGTGMAFPWGAVKNIDLAHGDITEDIRLGLELARLGYPARFCPPAGVRGEFPEHKQAAASQRKRWEHGHLRTLLRQSPRLAISALTNLRPSLLALALHVGIPPLALLSLIAAIGVVGLTVAGQFSPAMFLIFVVATTAIAVLVAWARFGRDRLPARDLLLLPYYVLKKIPLYLSFLIRPQREWVRTERAEPKP